MDDADRAETLALGASVLALAGALAGLGLFGLAVERSRPWRWLAAELDYDRARARDG